jgi:hypothetical protein
LKMELKMELSSVSTVKLEVKVKVPFALHNILLFLYSKVDYWFA